MIDGHLWFICRRGRQHLHIDVPATTTISVLQQHIRELLMTKELPKLKKPTNDELTEWADLDPSVKWRAAGITRKMARSEKPLVLAFVFEEDNDKVELAPMSKPKNMDHLKKKIPDQLLFEAPGPATV